MHDKGRTQAPASALLDAALGWAKDGFAVMPVHGLRRDGTCSCGNDSCSSPGKHPLITGWQHQATTDEQQIRSWFTKWPDANLAVIPGSNGCVGVDVDPRNGGTAHLDRLLAGADLNGTLIIASGQYGDARGRHIYFRADEAREVSKADAAPGVELKASGGYLLVPPSRHASGVSYEVASGSRDTISDAPQWVLEVLLGGAGEHREAQQVDPTQLTRLPLGQRTLDAIENGLHEPTEGGTQRLEALGIARNIREEGDFDRDDTVYLMRKVLLDHPESSLDPDRPWREEDVQKIVTEVFKRPAPDQARYLRSEAREQHDVANAARFAHEHAEYLRWVPEWNSWVYWDVGRWRRGPSEYAVRSMRNTFLKVAREAAAIADPDLRATQVKAAARCLSAARINAGLSLARAHEDLLTRAEEFDTDPWVLNCQNGVLDLMTGELREHRREDMHAQQTACDFDPNARSEDWDRAVNDALDGHEGTVAYVQKVFGYALTGDVSEEKFWLFHGESGAGKTTLLDAFGGMLGDYTRVMSYRSLTRATYVSSSGNASEDIARLAGGRFVVASEFERDTRLAEALVNSITGGEVIQARRLYQSTFEFHPQFKLFLAANHKPNITGFPQSGIWRRLQIVPFLHKVENVDRHLKRRLGTPEARAAILTWALEGCLRCRQEGLGDVPEVAQEALDEYRQESDPWSRFLAEATYADIGGFVTKAEMFSAYRRWASEQGIKHTTTLHKLGQILKERGVKDGQRETNVDGRRSSQRGWREVGLTPSGIRIQRRDVP